MSKSLTASAPKISASQPPATSAWAKGPPNSNLASNTPRSQSPSAATQASVNPTPTHSRKPSALGGPSNFNSTFKDGVSVPKGIQPSQKPAPALSFGTIAEPASPVPTKSAAAPSLSSDGPSLITFGTVSPDSVVKTSTTAKPATPAASSSPSPTPATAAAKPKLDVKALFRSNATPSSAPSPTSATAAGDSPAQRPAPLPLPPNQNPPPSHGYPHRSNGPSSAAPSAASPRISQYNRSVNNGAGSRGVPPNNPALNPSSPRMGQVSVTQPPHASQHLLSSHPVPSPLPHPQAGQWAPTPYYYYDNFWVSQPMPPAPSSHLSSPRPPVPVIQPGPTPPNQPSLPSLSTSTPSPFPPQASYPYPYSPPPPSTPQTPSGRLNSTAMPFVPQGTRAIQIRNPSSGKPVDLSSVAASRNPTEPPSSPALGSGHQRRPTEAAKVRIESEESHNKRLEEERRNKERQERAEQESTAKRQRDFEEKRRRREEEEGRKRKEDEERQAREDRERLEQERLEKERLERERIEKEKLEKERLEKERLEQERLEQERLEQERLEQERLEQERIERERKEQEEREKQERLEREKQEQLEREKREQEQREEQERLRKEEEERERLRKEAEEKERERLSLEEAERVRKEEEDKAVAREESEKKKDQDMSYAGSPAPSLITPSLPSRSFSSQASEPSKSKRPVPGPLDLSATSKPGLPPSLPSALATARAIDNLDRIQYPNGILSPKPELNAGASNGKFRYDREFLLQFMDICTEKPDSLPTLDAIGLEPVSNESNFANNRARGGNRPPPPNLGLKGNIPLGNSFPGKSTTPSQMLMGQFATAGGKMNQDDRLPTQMGRSTSVGGPGSAAFPRATVLMRTVSQGGAAPQNSPLGPSGRTRSQRGRNRQHDTTKPNAAPVPDRERERTSSMASNILAPPFEPVEPLKVSENRWMLSRRGPVDADPTEVVERKVKSLLNKLTMEKFDSISDQIIDWANKSENEKDGRTLIQVIRLVFEKATDEAAWSEMYARLCRKMMERISPNVQDETIRTTDGRPITGGQLFRKYLLNRCQEDFEQGWSMKEAAAKAAESKAADDKAAKDAAEEARVSGKDTGEDVLYSDEYYAAQKAKRRGLGLVKFIGELFKLQMLTERIMHECIKKLLGNVENPEEEEIESLCKLFTTIGRQLDTEKSSARIDVYIKRMEELSKSSHISSRMQYMLLDVLELRERKWVTRNVQIAPTTIAAVHEQAAKDQVKAQQEQSSRTAGRDPMSRGGSRRGEARTSGYSMQPGADGWTSVVQPRPTTAAGDLTKFGKIDKTGTTTLGPASVFSRKDVKGRENSVPRPTSTSNMFAMLNSEVIGEPPVAGKSSRPPSRKPSADFTQTGIPEAASQRKKLALLPRSLPRPGEDTKVLEEEVARSGDEAEPSLPPEKAKAKIGEDLKEFWALKNFDEADLYISSFEPSYRSQFIDQLIASTLERKDSEAYMAGELLTRWANNDLCPPSVMEEGFISQLEYIDDVAIDVPAAYGLVAILLKGSSLPRSSVEKLAGKIVVEGDPVLHPRDKLLKEYDSLEP